VPYRIAQCYLPSDRGDIPAFTPGEAGTRSRYNPKHKMRAITTHVAWSVCLFICLSVCLSVFVFFYLSCVFRHICSTFCNSAKCSATFVKISYVLFIAKKIPVCLLVTRAELIVGMSCSPRNHVCIMQVHAGSTLLNSVNA